MGICLDTEQSNENKPQVSGEADARKTGKWREEAGLLATPPEGNFPMQNVGPVKFEVPTVPVIFILGGPGSGKVTHCDNLSHEKSGIVHINMTDLLQQYAMGNDMQDFNYLSSKTVTEVLMLEMKMSPGTKTYLVSGYPRNMRDVVEYSEKIQIVNGVILISWRQEVLERQIDYGAQLGHVILQLARMELNNFFRNVMPVAEYFDQSELLIQVNGERNPSEVYTDFRDAVYKILGFTEDGPKNLKANAKSLETQVEVERHNVDSASSEKKVEEMSPDRKNITPAKTAVKRKIPPFIWVIGGPGSNKAIICNRAIRNMPGWIQINIGELLRGMSSSNMIVSNALSAGELVPLDITLQILEQQVRLNHQAAGLIVNGFPRDLNQVHEFESKFGREPPLVLLDCSKLQLSRSRSDDSVASFRKRLEIFREVTLPMLKTLDNDGRLTVIDGDTGVPSVQQEFVAVVLQLSQNIAEAAGKEDRPNGEAPANINGGPRIEDYDLRRASGTQMNGHIKNMRVPQSQQNGVANGAAHLMQNGSASHLVNGLIPNNKVVPMNNSITNEHIKKMYNEIDFNAENVHL